MTGQEVFDTVVAHLRKQGKKATERKLVGGSGLCRYLTSDGLKCAAGCLIDPNEYRRDMEGKRIVAMLDGSYPDIVPLSMIDRLSPHLLLIAELQLVHDDNKVEEWENKFERCATKFGLTYLPPQDI